MQTVGLRRTAPPSLCSVVFSRNFLCFYVMATCSIFQGYYTQNVFKQFGQTRAALEDDLYLTQVGMFAATFNMLRLFWSAVYDLPGVSFK